MTALPPDLPELQRLLKKYGQIEIQELMARLERAESALSAPLPTLPAPDLRATARLKCYCTPHGLRADGTCASCGGVQAVVK